MLEIAVTPTTPTPTPHPQPPSPHLKKIRVVLEHGGIILLSLPLIFIIQGTTLHLQNCSGKFFVHFFFIFVLDMYFSGFFSRSQFFIFHKI
jgi:hypothetical protein